MSEEKHYRLRIEGVNCLPSVEVGRAIENAIKAQNFLSAGDPVLALERLKLQSSLYEVLGRVICREIDRGRIIFDINGLMVR